MNRNTFSILLILMAAVAARAQSSGVVDYKESISPEMIVLAFEVAPFSVEHLITDFATDSLLDLHPPRIFQIDGNLGGMAAVIEMLIQSYHEEIHLLPALPAAWPEGKASGLRARGGFSIDVTWADGALTQATVRATHSRPCRIRDPEGRLIASDESGAAIATRHEGNFLVFDTTAGPTVALRVG